MELRADVPTVAAALAASLSASDGVVTEEEKAVASTLGARFFRGFSSVMFETLLEGVTTLPPATELASTLRPFLKEDDKTLVMEYLVGVATADDKVEEAERRQLQEIASALGTALPSLTASAG